MKFYMIKTASTSFLEWASTKRASETAKDFGFTRTLECLLQLIYLYKEGIGTSTHFDMSGLFGPIQKHLSCIIAMRNVVKDPALQPYLYQLEPVIHEFDSLESSGIDIDITSDIKKLTEAYEADMSEDEPPIERLTRKEKIRLARVQMTQDLISRISTSLSSAAHGNGDYRLAKLLNDGEITNLEKIFNYCDFSLDRATITLANTVVDYLWQHYGEKFYDENYWYVKQAVWGIIYGGYRYLEKMQQQINHHRTMKDIGGSDASYSEFIESSDIPNSEIADTLAIPFVSVILYQLIQKIAQSESKRY